MKVYVITGMSGAGKSSAAKHLEDLGFFCVDNLPPSLIPKFVEICMHSSDSIKNVALVTDIRGGVLLNELIPSLDEIKHMGITYKIVFLDASSEVLINRYKESRRAHPLAQHGRILSGLTEEREILDPIKSIATYIIDTSKLSARQFKEEMVKLVSDEVDFTDIVVNLMSFGFKHGVPIDCDLILDVRFAPNPFYIPELKNLTGKDQKVSDYVFSFEETRVFMDKLFSMLEYLLPYYKREGKAQLVVALGCTGGKHRSVAMAERIASGLADRNVTVTHRDLGRE